MYFGDFYFVCDNSGRGDLFDALVNGNHWMLSRKHGFAVAAVYDLKVWI